MLMFYLHYQLRKPFQSPLFLPDEKGQVIAEKEPPIMFSLGSQDFSTNTLSILDDSTFQYLYSKKEVTLKEIEFHAKD